MVNLEAEAAPAGSMTVVLGPGWPGVLLHEAVGHGLEGDFNLVVGNRINQARIGIRLLDGRFNVSFEDVRRVYLPAMRHRVILNFEAQAEGMESDQVLLDILQKLPEKSDEVPTATVKS